MIVSPREGRSTVLVKGMTLVWGHSPRTVLRVLSLTGLM